MASFQQTVENCKACDGLIIDLRGNPGGIGGMAMGMAGFLVDKPNQRLGTMYLRDSTLNFVVNPRANVFSGPVAVLVDGCSASTSEIFAGGLKDLGRARVFGTHTAAAALPSAFERLPNGDGFQYAVANYISEGGQPLEGLGVTPDVVVELTRAGAAGRPRSGGGCGSRLDQEAEEAMNSSSFDLACWPLLEPDSRPIPCLRPHPFWTAMSRSPAASRPTKSEKPKLPTGRWSFPRSASRDP